MERSSFLRRKVSFVLLFLGMVSSPCVLNAENTNVDSLRVAADSLHALGDSLLEAGRYSDAIVPFEQEIELRKELFDTAGLCEALNKNSEAHWRSWDTERGLDLAEEALKLGKETFGEEDTLVSASYYNIGAVYYSLGVYESSLENFEKALAICLEALGPEHPSVAASYNSIGVVYDDLGDYEQALENYQKALKIRLEALGPEHPYVAASYNNIGVVYGNLGEYERALENHEKALATWLKALGPEHPHVASSYSNIGDVYGNLGEYERALENYEKDLAITLKAVGPEHPDVAASYNNIGSVYYYLGDYERALENYEKALAIRLKALGPEHPYVATSYNNIGIVYDDLGSYEQALENYQKALKIRLEALGPEHPYVAASYNNIGVVYRNLGDYQQALDNYQKALDIFIKVLGPVHPHVASSYNNIGLVYHYLGDYERALEYYEKDLAITLKALGPEHPHVAHSYNNIGNVYDDLGEYQNALESHGKALAILLKTLGPEHPGVATSYNNIGAVYHYHGDYERALERYEKALAIRLKALSPEHPDVAMSYNGIGRVYRAQDQPDSALVYYEKSIDVFEKSRGEIESEELRKSYTETVTGRYEAIISLLLEMGRPEDAFEYLERSKSKSLKDALDERYDLTIGKGELKQKLKESRLLATKIAVFGDRLLEERLKPETERIETRIGNLSRQLEEARTAYDSLTTEIAADPDYLFAVRVEPARLSDIRQNLPPGQKLLMIYSGEEELYLFLVSRDCYVGQSVKISRDSLNYLISSCRDFCCDTARLVKLDSLGKLYNWSWGDDGSEFYKKEVAPFKSVLSELYGYLIDPLEEELASAEVVIIIPSGNLYYLPWGALLDQEGDSLVFLTERYNWNLLTSTELLRCIQRREARAPQRPLKRIALVGNPTVDILDILLSRCYPLPETEEEVYAVKKTYPRSTILIGNEATEGNVRQIASKTEALHLATHGCLMADSPWESYIYLAPDSSGDRKWTVEEISGESWKRMQLVTLSACETALGGRYPGVETESMAKAFSLAMEGPPSIVATLWPVYDPSTKELMVTFYEELKDNPKSEALRCAQQKLIHSAHAHPYFWAPFILIGDWR